MADKAKVRVIRVRLHDDSLQTNVLRGLGFRAECDCGWKGQRTQTMTLARAEMRWHRYEHERAAPQPPPT